MFSFRDSVIDHSERKTISEFIVIAILGVSGEMPSVKCLSSVTYFNR